MLEVTVHTDGPLLAGRGPEVVRRFTDDATYEVAGQGRADVMTNLERSVRHPTPYYETQVKTERAGRDMSVNDSGVIYGPWLEGTSSRNTTTKFKGYASFRRAAQQLQGQVPALVAPILHRYLSELN